MGRRKKVDQVFISEKDFIKQLHDFNDNGLGGTRRKIVKIDVKRRSDYGFCPEADDFVGAFVQFKTGHTKFFYFTKWASDTTQSFRVYSPAYDDPKRVEAIIDNWNKDELEKENQ